MIEDIWWKRCNFLCMYFFHCKILRHWWIFSYQFPENKNVLLLYLKSRKPTQKIRSYRVSVHLFLPNAIFQAAIENCPSKTANHGEVTSFLLFISFCSKSTPYCRFYFFIQSNSFRQTWSSGLIPEGGHSIAQKKHKRQRRKRQSVTAKREKSQTSKFV